MRTRLVAVLKRLIKPETGPGPSWSGGNVHLT